MGITMPAKAPANAALISVGLRFMVLYPSFLKTKSLGACALLLRMRGVHGCLMPIADLRHARANL